LYELQLAISSNVEQFPDGGRSMHLATIGAGVAPVLVAYRPNPLLIKSLSEPAALKEEEDSSVPVSSRRDWRSGVGGEDEGRSAEQK